MTAHASVDSYGLFLRRQPAPEGLRAHRIRQPGDGNLRSPAVPSIRAGARRSGVRRGTGRATINEPEERFDAAVA
jgi:hypothetical protein